MSQWTFHEGAHGLISIKHCGDRVLVEVESGDPDPPLVVNRADLRLLADDLRTFLAQPAPAGGQG